MRKRILLFLIASIIAIGITCLIVSKDKIVELDSHTIKDTNENVYQKNIIEDEILGTLIIDKIGLNAPVKEGSSEEVLESYIGHIEETDMFNGNIGFAAHNRGNKYSYFSRLNELSVGDEIEYINKINRNKYIVSEIKVILDTDWNMLSNSAEDKITMITCIKNRPSQRLCVQAVKK